MNQVAAQSGCRMSAETASVWHAIAAAGPDGIGFEDLLRQLPWAKGYEDLRDALRSLKGRYINVVGPKGAIVYRANAAPRPAPEPFVPTFTLQPNNCLLMRLEKGWTVTLIPDQTRALFRYLDQLQGVKPAPEASHA